MRKKAALDEQVPFLIDTDIDSKEFRKNWISLGNRTIVTGGHCFGCTSGAGSSYSGALEGGVS